MAHQVLVPKVGMSIRTKREHAGKPLRIGVHQLEHLLTLFGNLR